MKHFKKYLILLIIILALFIRGFHLGNLPSLNPDEAALGYNAYSLLLTGKDEHGAKWPLHFRSFGDYKPGGYIYLDLPFIFILGLNPLAVRLPNLILSVLTIFVVYKLVELLSKNHTLALISALVLTLNPWHIHFSRGAWETSSALFFIVLGIYWFYLYVIKQKKIYLYLFPISLATSLYFYHSARIITPLLFITIFIAYFYEFKPRIQRFFLPFILGIVLCLPVVISFIRTGGTARFNSVGLTADYGPIARAEELLNQHGNTLLFNRIIHNKRLLYSLSWIQKYTSHFDLNFLFINGDEVPRSKSPEMGQLYLIELPFIFLGIIYIFKKYTPSHLSRLIFLFLFISPIASSLTFQAPSALRSLPMVIPLSIIISCGLIYLRELTVKIFPHTVFFLLLLYIYSLFYFLDAYFIRAPQRYPFAWNTGFSTIVPLINTAKSKFSNIYLTNKYDQPYILYLFYSQYPPQKIQAQISLTEPDKFGFSTVNQIDNIHFGKIDWDSISDNSLVIAADEKVPQFSIKNYYFPNQEIGFKIYIK